MTASKYAAMIDRKQEVIGLDITSLPISHGRTSVIASAEPARIVLHWYSHRAIGATAAGWHQHTIEHRRYSPGRTIPEMNDALSLPWSQRVAMAATDQHLVVVYKRRRGSLTGLFLSRFDWDRDQEDLTQRGDPVPLPTQPHGISEIGFSLWAGFDEISNNVVVLTQSWRDPGPTLGLRLLRASIDHVLATPDDPAIWTVDDVASGGFDLDARLDAGQLTFVFRQQPYTMTVVDPRLRFDGDVHELRLDQAENLRINPALTVRTIDTTTLDVLQEHNGVPGGAHPQIQRLDPLFLTCDRVDSGIIRVAAEPGAGEDEPPAFARFAHLIGQKQLLRLAGEDWFSIDLMPIDFRVHPRHVLYHTARPRSVRRESGQFIMAAEDGRLSTALLHPLLPTHLVHFELNRDKGTEILDLIHHETEMSAVLQTRFELRPDVEEQSLRLIDRTFRVLDINHEPIPATREIASQGFENEQFRPFATARFRLPPGPDAAVSLPRDAYRLDNTLGGLLAVDPRTPGLDLYAYTDLGDAGVRVIHLDEPLTEPPTVPWNEKELPPDAVTGSGAPADQWVTLTHPEGEWLPAGLPGFLSPPMLSDGRWPAVDWTLGSQLEAIVDALFALYYEFDTVGQTAQLRIEESLTSRFEEETPTDEPLWQLIWSPFDAIPPNRFVAGLGGSLRVAKYLMTYNSVVDPDNPPVLSDGDGDGDGAGLAQFRDSIEVSNVAAYETDLRFLREPGGQGRIECRTRLDFTITQTVLAPFLASIAILDFIKISMYQRRMFTPAILMSERRARNRLTNRLDDTPFEMTRRPMLTENGDVIFETMAPAALSARPVGSTQVDLEEVDVSVQMRPFNWAIVSLVISALLTLGLFGLAAILIAFITGGISIIVSGIALPIAIGAAIALFLTTYFLAAPAIAGILTRIIESEFDSNRERVVDALNRVNLLGYAGEGIGEAIARMVLRHPDVDVPLDEEHPAMEGRNRFRMDFWQTIFVGDGFCRVLIRK